MATLNEKNTHLASKRRQNTRRRGILAVLGCIVVMVTAFALMVPAISMSRSELTCGIEEHTHGDACYEQVLVCGQEESEGHVHSDACYEQVLACGQEEGEDHVHTDACYEKQLACGQEESEGHVHSDACYESQLKCDKPEHTHTEACYTHEQAAVSNSASESSSATSGVTDKSSSASSAASTVSASSAAASKDADKMPAVKFEKKLERIDAPNVKVTVKAPEGALPEGATMEAKFVPADDVKTKVEEAIERENGEEAKIKNITVVDIVFKDKTGKEIEPAKAVEVKITSDDVNKFEKPLLVHVLDKAKESSKDNPYDAEVIAKVKIVNEDDENLTVGTEDTMKFESKAFSPYAVVELDSEQAADSKPAVVLEGQAGDITVVATAPEGAFPEGTTLEAAAVQAEDVQGAVEAAIAEDGVFDSFAAVQQIDAVNVTFRDAEGKAIDPEGAVQVSLTNANAPEAGDLVVVSVDEQDAARVVEQTVAITGNDEAVFETEASSTYAMVTLETITAKFLSADGKTYEVTVTYGPDAEIPEGSTLSVTEYAEGSAEYQEAYKRLFGEESNEESSEEATYTVTEYADSDPYTVTNSYPKINNDLNAFLGLSVLDISIIGPDGNKVEPAASVDVKVEVKSLDSILDKDEQSELKGVTVMHMDESSGEIQAVPVADNGNLVSGEVKLFDGESEAPVVAEFSLDSFSKFVFQFDNRIYPNHDAIDPPVRTYTVHYGYMDGGSFVEFPEGEPSMAPHTYQEYSEANPDPNVVDYDSSSTNHKRQFLVYDVDDYIYQSCYYSETETAAPTSATRIYPILHKESNMCYYPYQSNGNESGAVAVKDGSHVYMIYKGYAPTQGGSSDVQIDDLQDQVPEPAHEKKLVDNENGTYTLSLNVTGTEIPNTFKTKAELIVIMDRSGSMGGNNAAARWTVAKNAVKTLADTVLSKNVEGEDPVVSMSLISFSSSAAINATSVTDAATFKQKVDGLSAPSGSTNWEFPLRLANSIAVDPEAETYIIFISDGTPNLYVKRGEVSDDTIMKNDNLLYHPKSSYAVNNHSGIWGTGSDSGNPELLKFARDKAIAAGKEIVGKDKHLYVIGGFASSNLNVTQYMKDFTSGSYADKLSAAEAIEKYYRSANDEEELKETFAGIVSDMSIAFGQINVNMVDGVTDMTELNAKDEVVGLDHADDFKYYRSGGMYGDKTEWTTIPEANKAKFENGNLIWDLEGIGLEDGVTYTLEVIVWPNQHSYDLITGLNEGTIDWNTGVTEQEKEQLVRKPVYDDDGTTIIGYTYSLNTNEDEPAPSLTYCTYLNNNGNVERLSDPITATPFTNPDPVPLVTRKLKIVKTWNDDLDPTQRPDLDEDDEIDDISFEIFEDGTKIKDISFPLRDDQGQIIHDPDTGKSIWEYEFFISPGLQVDGITYNTGHDYTATENNVDYHFEARIETVHPTLIDSNSEITLVGDGATGDEEPDGFLTVFNDLKGGIDILKTAVIPQGIIQSTPVVLDGNVNADLAKKFKIKVTMENDNASLTTDTTAGAPNYGFGYRIVYGPNNNTPIASRQNYGSANFPYGRSGRLPITDGAFQQEIYDGDQIMVTNVPSNTTYTVEEEIAENIWIVTYDNETGTVVANQANDVVVTNTLKDYLLKLLKVDIADTDNPLSGAVFDLYGNDYYLADGTTVNPDREPLKTLTATNDEGLVEVGDLAAGVYYLEETSAPSGFLLLTSPVKVTVTADGITYEQVSNSLADSSAGVTPITDDDGKVIGFQITVTNTSGVELPMTGGPGTMLFSVLGLALVLGAVTTMVVRRRKEWDAEA